jgi:hypothetical protein
MPRGLPRGDSLVEDDIDVAKLLINFLIKSGFKAKSANNAEGAVKI